MRQSNSGLIVLTNLANSASLFVHPKDRLKGEGISRKLLTRRDTRESKKPELGRYFTFIVID